MKNSLFPSVREAVLVIVITAFFLILTAVCIGLRPEHFLRAGVFLVLFFAWHMQYSLVSRRRREVQA